jgi:nuclease S1
MRILRIAPLALAIAAASAASPGAWGGQGHRLVGLIAARHLTPVAQQNVAWLLEKQTLADVASWADSIVGDQQQTGWWHYLNIPPDASGYNRNRDCPRQPGVADGSRADTWRDCIVDRIAYHEQRAGDVKLDRADRAVALKFVVHFIGDLHQPFHALGVGRGGNDVLVRVFGAANCGNDPAKPTPCNLHSVWDSRLIAHRATDDAAYLAALEKLILAKGWMKTAPGTPADWAVESWKLAKAALVANDTNIDEAYYRAQIPVIDERLAQAGVRLAHALNRVFVAPPPS